MDYGERLAKVEAEVDSIREQLHEIRAEQIRLREGLEKLRDHMDRGFAEMRAGQARTTRWLIGMGISYGAAIIGLIAKVAGLF
jgi:regulator of replication initiation timing